MLYLLALSIGIVAGLRAMTAPAAVSWAAYAGWLDLSGTGLAFLGHPVTPWIATALAIGELITDQLPTTPSRTVPVAFGTRILVGAVCGAALVATHGSMWVGGVAGAAGAILGTLGGRSVRGRLAKAFGRDRPAAFLEDAVAITAAFLIMLAAR
jgi:uncharacterized membrane protein